LSGDTSSFTASYSSSNCASTYTLAAKDFVAVVTPDVDGTMTCDLGGSSVTPWDAVLYVRSNCTNASSELACDDAGVGADEVELPVAKNTPYYVFVDGWGSGKEGPFVLTCTVKVPYCGNGDKEGTEECDDGNNTPNDGCNADCEIEPKGPADVCPGTTLPLMNSGGTYIAYLTGSTSGQTNAYNGTCNSSSTAPDQVYQFNSGPGGNVTVTVPADGTTFNTALYVRQGACFGPSAVQVGCKDATYGNGNETVTFQAPPNTTYWVIVDGSSSASGNFSLEIRVVPTCGDGNLDVGEQCDDGDKTPGDGCDANCNIEATCGGLTETEPNLYSTPNVIPAACGTFVIPNASISAVGDSDHFRINNLPAGAKVDAYAYLDTFGSCSGGSVLVVSLWKIPITNPGSDYGLCTGQGASVACSSSATDGNCAKMSHTVASGAVGDYILKVHGSSTVTNVPKYGLRVMIH
jgi:cysteine-rich repeat protein